MIFLTCFDAQPWESFTKHRVGEVGEKGARGIRLAWVRGEAKSRRFVDFLTRWKIINGYCDWIWLTVMTSCFSQFVKMRKTRKPAVKKEEKREETFILYSDRKITKM